MSLNKVLTILILVNFSYGFLTNEDVNQLPQDCVFDWLKENITCTNISDIRSVTDFIGKSSKLKHDKFTFKILFIELLDGDLQVLQFFDSSIEEIGPNDFYDISVEYLIFENNPKLTKISKDGFKGLENTTHLSIKGKNFLHLRKRK